MIRIRGGHVCLVALHFFGVVGLMSVTSNSNWICIRGIRPKFAQDLAKSTPGMAGRSCGKRFGFYQKFEQIGCVAGASAFSGRARILVVDALPLPWRNPVRVE